MNCLICNKEFEEEHLIVFGRSLSVHHIDYNKYNNSLSNLLCLCNQCHTRVNYNRVYWADYLKEVMPHVCQD